MGHMGVPRVCRVFTDRCLRGTLELKIRTTIGMGSCRHQLSIPFTALCLGFRI